jgi:large subunit ribosomal protein L1
MWRVFEVASVSKARRKALERIERGKVYPAEEAFALVKELAHARFTEAVDVAINLGVDPKKSDQVVRGSTVLPHGTGKKMRVAVFAQGANAEAAKEAGADIVGMEDLAERVQAGQLDFDVVIASPDAMRVVGKLGQILGPRGLMPNPKVGTVTPDVAGAVRNAKAGQVRYRTDRAGTVHCRIGDVSFEVPALQQNLSTLLADLNKAKPSAAKGVYLKKVCISSTMGPGFIVDQATIEAAADSAR